MLRSMTYGEPTSPRLLIAHGLFGSARNWGVISKRLSNDFHVIAVDMRNHGESPRFSTNTYEDMANDLAEVINTIGPCDILGHSMGGKASMMLALSRPELVKRLIIADIAPVGYGHTQLHLIEAMRGVDLATVSTRGDADRQLKDKIPEDGIRAFLLQSLDIKNKLWRLNLDVLDADMDHIIGFPDIAGQFSGPTLFLSGGSSDYVLPEHRSLVKPLFPQARFAKLPGTGHWLHAEKPRDFEKSVRVFLLS